MKASSKKVSSSRKKKASRRFEIRWFLILCGLGVLLSDIATKYYVQLHIPRISHEAQWYPYRGVGVFEDFLGIELSIVHGTNSGAAWGLFADYQEYLLLFRILFVSLLAVYLIGFNRVKEISLPLTLILCGAIGNILDYFFYGHVVDMVHFVFWGFDYPSFNIADSAIFVGVWWIFILNLTGKHNPVLFRA